MFGSTLANAQVLVLFALSVAAFGLEAYAVIDALRHRPDAYLAASKRTKGFWVAVTGVSAVIGFVSLMSTSILNIIPLLAVVGAAVYLADVRPALRQVSGRRGGGGTMGPYGPW